MRIIIKSFNRPYYLERCLRSIYKYAEGPFSIQVLDDGTPPEYLDKIKSLFPEVSIVTSPEYAYKWKAINDHVKGLEKYNRYSIPVNFWVEHVSNASAIFLLLEDDIWLTDQLPLNDIEQTMLDHNIDMLKIAWQGNLNVNRGKKIPIGRYIEEIKPAIPFLAKVIFFNRFKVRSVLYRLGFIKSGMQFQLPFYALYNVASVCFHKAYWLYLWREVPSKVNEPIQLKKAYQWYKQEKSRYGKTVKELATTSYLSSATNNFLEIDFDIICFNYYVNHAWLNDELDVMENFPADFTPNVIKPILEKANDKRCTYANWLKWVEGFKEQYRKVGCIVD